jgi:hypothetical protein
MYWVQVRLPEQPPPWTVSAIDEDHDIRAIKLHLQDEEPRNDSRVSDIYDYVSLTFDQVGETNWCSVRAALAAGHLGRGHDHKKNNKVKECIPLLRTDILAFISPIFVS